MKHRRGEGSMNMEAEIGMMQSQAKECWQPPEARRGKEADPPLEPLEGAQTCCDTLTLAQ